MDKSLKGFYGIVRIFCFKLYESLRKTLQIFALKKYDLLSPKMQHILINLNFPKE